jgi:8-amino-7-oxononanoate synthase
LRAASSAVIIRQPQRINEGRRMSDPDPIDSLNAFVTGKLDGLRAASLYRSLHANRRGPQAKVTRAGRELLSFCCNDYLGLSQHPAVIEASVQATRDFGAGAGASRFVSGEHPLYRQLETALARFKGYQDAVIFGSGYLANSGVIPCLAGPEDLLVMDELNHACLFAGATLSRGVTRTYAHGDLQACERILEQERKHYRHALLISDGVFSMDGDQADVPRLADLARHHDAWLMIDDAHGFGVLNAGRGSTAIADAPARVPLSMGTLSKAAGSYGGYLCASGPVIDFVRNRARSLIYTTGLPPGTIAAASAALDIIAADPQLCAQPHSLAKLFCTTLGLPEPDSCIVPMLIGEPARALQISQQLEQRGFLVTAIRPPTVPAGTARLRFTFTAMHDEQQVMALAAAVAELVAS